MKLIKKINVYFLRLLLVTLSTVLVVTLAACDNQEETQEFQNKLEYIESLTINLHEKGFSESHLEYLVGETLIVKMNDDYIDSESLLDSERQYNLTITSEFIQEVQLITAYDGNLSDSEIVLIGDKEVWSTVFHYVISYQEHNLNVTINQSITNFIVVAPCDGGWKIMRIRSNEFFNFENLTHLVLPDKYLGENIICIATNALINSSLPGITNIVVPNGFTTIEERAFNSSESLTEVSIQAESLEFLHHNAFNNIPLLKSLNIIGHNDYYYSINGVVFDNDGVYIWPHAKSKNFTISVENNNEILEVVTFGEGYKVDLPEENEKYDFDGYVDQYGIKITDENGYSLNPYNYVHDIVLIPTYTIKKFTVKFIDSGTILKTETVEYGNAGIAPAGLISESHDHVGWDKSFEVVKSDLEVYTVWKIKTFDISFDIGIQAATELGINQKIQYDVEYGTNATAPNIIRPGYILIWNKPFNNIIENTHVEAIWTTDIYDIVLSIAHGTVVDEKGYAYNGEFWVKSMNFLDEFSFPIIFSGGYIVAWSTIEIDHENKQFISSAVYEKERYEITYTLEKNGVIEGTLFGVSRYYYIEDYAQELVTSSNIDLSRYDFNGWEDENGNLMTHVTANTYGNIQVFARLSLKEYTLRLPKRDEVNFEVLVYEELLESSLYEITESDGTYILVVHHGSSLEFKYTLLAAYNKSTFDLTVNGLLINPVNGIIHFANILENIDLVIESILELNTYTIALPLDNEKVIFNLSDSTVMHGGTFTLDAQLTNAYNQAQNLEVRVNGELVILPFTCGFAFIDSEITFNYAELSINRYMIKFNIRGLLFHQDNIFHGGMVTAPLLYDQVDKTFTNEWLYNGDIFDFNQIILGNVTLEAEWSVRTYKVVYTMENGEYIHEEYLDYGSNVEFIYTTQSHDFSHWVTIDGQSWDLSIDLITGETFLVASLVIRQYNVVFNPFDGGEYSEKGGVDADNIATHGSNISLKLNIKESHDQSSPIVRYLVAGVWETAVITDDMYHIMDVTFDVEIMVTNVEINKYIVQFYSEPSKKIDSFTVEHGDYILDVPNSDFTKVGHYYETWERSINGQKVTDDEIRDIMMYNNEIFIVQWIVMTYSVNFIAEFALAPLENIEVKFQSQVDFPTPKYDAYIKFLGWQFEDKTGINGKIFTPLNPDDSNVTLYAKEDVPEVQSSMKISDRLALVDYSVERLDGTIEILSNVNEVTFKSSSKNEYSTLNIVIMERGSSPLVIRLYDFSFKAADDEHAILMINSSAMLTIENHGFSHIIGGNASKNSNGMDAINANSSMVVIDGQGKLTISGGNGRDATSSNIVGNGGTGIMARALNIKEETMIYLEVEGGFGGTGSIGINGQMGGAGYDANANFLHIGTTGTGETGRLGNDGGNGGNGGAAIVASNININNSKSSFYFIGGSGGAGGKGGNGGSGGRGGNANGTWIARGGNGGTGGQGGNGGVGGNGNYAIIGTLTFQGSGNLVIIGGSGGSGGQGGNGGSGGNGGYSGSSNLVSKRGGTGGTGGNGGDGGDYGKSSEATSSFATGLFDSNSGKNGIRGNGGNGGPGGIGGLSDSREAGGNGGNGGNGGQGNIGGNGGTGGLGQYGTVGENNGWGSEGGNGGQGGNGGSGGFGDIRGGNGGNGGQGGNGGRGGNSWMMATHGASGGNGGNGGNGGQGGDSYITAGSKGKGGSGGTGGHGGSGTGAWWASAVSGANGKGGNSGS